LPVEVKLLATNVARLGLGIHVRNHDLLAISDAERNNLAPLARKWASSHSEFANNVPASTRAR
jgi:hypothetical protein